MDWFNSREIWVETTVAGLAFYLFVVHTLTARQPFIRRELFRDGNFITGNVFSFIISMVLLATLALLPTMLQTLFNYPVLTAGVVTAPRGVGTLIGMLVVGQLVGRIDSRLIIAVGFLVSALSLWQMTNYSPDMDRSPVIWAGLTQGLGTGIAYVPMATMTFATLNPALRNEGTAMFNLMRNVGSSVGISMVQALLISNIQISHASLSVHVSPYNLANRDPQLAAQLASHVSLAGLNARVTGQNALIAYIDDFQLMLILTLASLPMLLLVRPATRKVEDDTAYLAVE